LDTSVTSIHIEDGVNGYVDLVHHVLRNGRTVSPRGMKTREIEDATIFIENIYSTLPLGVGRGAVPGIGAVEACQLLSGVSMPELVIAVGPQFVNYAEDNGIFHGAYGLRTKGQYKEAINKLKNDSDTRQAVITIWNPEYDNQPNKRDYPCTILHQFRIRDRKLNMSVYMRSNDVWLGAAYDFFQFTRVQLAMCSVLGIPPGTYSHHVGSLHIYEQHYEVAENLTKTSANQQIPFIQGSSWDEVETQALDALFAVADDRILSRLSQNSSWYADAMVDAVAKNARKANNE
jgi:thymidylate synthase